MKPERPTWLEIDLGAISSNIRNLRARLQPSCVLMGVVKANAYGHGAVRVAQTAIDAGASHLAVATLGEALELRQASITTPILVLGYTLLDHVAPAIANDVTLTVYDPQMAKALDYHASSLAMKASVHVKINTGMNRLGLRPAECLDYLSHLATYPNLQVAGIYTHFANADEADQSFAREQFKQFQTMLKTLKEARIRPALAHAANSAATLSMPETHLDMVRTGIAMYGLHPDPKSCRLPENFRPALTWKATVAQTHHLESGETVGYGREFMAKCPTLIAVIPVGYADGFPRKPQHWDHVLIKGRPTPLIGRVCMDQSMVDISPLQSSNLTPPNHSPGSLRNRDSSDIRQGDEVVLIGSQNDATLTAEDVAEQIGTNNYDVVSRILSRVPRIYV